MNRAIHVALLHAYSSRNAGDGLLVDLSIDLLREAFGPTVRVSIVAADPASFPDYPDVQPAPVLADTGVSRVMSALGSVLPISMNPAMSKLRDLLHRVDLIVGVGGGYLRARHTVEALKLKAGHLSQMHAARAAGKPTVYLPQSIGPAANHPLLARHMRSLLAPFNAVFVRDDRSAAFLARNANTHRAPDLAVLAFGQRAAALLARAVTTRAPPAHIAFVLRGPPAWSATQRARYHSSTLALIQRLRASCRLSFAVQSKGRGNDDSAFYRELGIEATQSLKSVLAEDTPDAVVSVRLHGALEAILHGVPAYHLSYERKGFGAYADLGLDNWVANAADFHADAVAATLLGPDARQQFWQAAGAGLERLKQQREQILVTLRAASDATRHR
jgi:polysaccharide pyruvyl transferase WcaK-like protein